MESEQPKRLSIPKNTDEDYLTPQSLLSPSLVSPGNDQFTSAVAGPSSVVQRRVQVVEDIGREGHEHNFSKIPLTDDDSNNSEVAPVQPAYPSVTFSSTTIDTLVQVSQIEMPSLDRDYPDFPMPVSPASKKPHENAVYFSYDPETGEVIDSTSNPHPVTHQGLILVDREPTLGHRNKPTHLLRKPTEKRRNSTAGESITRQNVPRSNAESIFECNRSMVTSLYKPKNEVGSGWWYILSRILTIWAPNFILRKTIGDKNTIQAWREKISLCTIIAAVGASVAFLTLGLQPTLCPASNEESIQISEIKNGAFGSNTFIIQGVLYDLGKHSGPRHTNLPAFSELSENGRAAFNALSGINVTPLFSGGEASENCASVSNIPFPRDCVIPEFPKISYCHQTGVGSAEMNALKLGKVRYPWGELSKNLLVYNGRVLDLGSYFKSNNKFFGEEIHQELLNNTGRDATLAFSRTPNLSKAAICLQTLYTVGFVDVDSPGCILSQVILSLSLVIIVGLVMIRFLLAVGFHWILSWRLGKLQKTRAVFAQVFRPRTVTAYKFKNKDANEKSSSKDSKGVPEIQSKKVGLIGDPKKYPSLGRQKNVGFIGEPEKFTSIGRQKKVRLVERPSFSDMMLPDNTRIPDELRPYYTVVLVTCYSEGEAELKKTLDSVAATSFPDEQKLLFVVADGIITGKGNAKSTPDLVLELMDEVHIGPVDPVSYIAIADGVKRHNKARVHVGWYCSQGHRMPTIVIVKSGNDDEQGLPKPGNRGKRDSQIILMDFFSKILLGDKICPLQFEMFYKIHALTGVHPLKYEIVLMCDADTKIFHNSLSRMVACMAQDSSIMGLCGETRIDNKAQTWVTMIQVFEYYISHHLGKAFESIFGGVTCLPGCFCMYRMKVERPDKLWVPILCSPAVIAAYSENVVDTLHKKNLLSLGEDRYLSSLMLKSFPLRKMMFVPRAVCHTIVPHTLTMLLSQRRRWINSTIHNLLELVLVRQLCGTFCFSMQFVVFLELVGTVSLPVAISMTCYLIYQALTGNVQLIPMMMLVCILGLPAVLIMLTTKQFHYIFWMLIFLVSLPVWNFILPVYAFWHFDDFSWGDTRKVSGEQGHQDHGKKEGEFDVSDVSFLSLTEWLQYVPNCSTLEQISNSKLLPSAPSPKIAKTKDKC